MILFDSIFFNFYILYIIFNYLFTSVQKYFYFNIISIFIKRLKYIYEINIIEYMDIYITYLINYSKKLHFSHLLISPFWLLTIYK